MVFPDFDPVALYVGPLAIRWYGLMYLIGFAAAACDRGGGESSSLAGQLLGGQVIDAAGLAVAPGFIDMQSRFREGDGAQKSLYLPVGWLFLLLLLRVLLRRLWIAVLVVLVFSVGTAMPGTASPMMFGLFLLVLEVIRLRRTTGNALAGAFSSESP